MFDGLKPIVTSSVPQTSQTRVKLQLCSPTLRPGAPPCRWKKNHGFPSENDLQVGKLHIFL